MKYQLVVQLPCDSMDDYDAIVDLESQLIESLSENAVVDGHDAGGGTMNLFLFTNDPVAVFDLIKPTIQSTVPLEQVVAASRLVDQETYQVIHPADFAGDFRVL